MAKITKSPGIEKPFDDVFPVPVLATRAPAATDTRFPLGQVWVRTDTAQVYHLAQLAGGAATWALSSPGASDVDTINSLTPTAGNMIVDGGTNITDTNAGSTVTINLDDAITLATSVTSPIYTTGAGADTNINAVAGQDLLLQMGDAAAANKVSFETDASAEVASIDSAGTATFVNIDGILGATTPAAGTFTSATANTSFISGTYTVGAAADLNIDGVTGQDVIIKMGDNAAANKVSFTDSDDAEVASIDSDGVLTSTALTFAGLLTASASATIETAGTTLNLASDNDAAAVNLGVGTTARAIGIGNSAAAHVITIGSVTGAAQVVLNSGTAGIQLASTGAGDITINSSDTVLIDSAGVLELNSSAGIINIGDDAVAQNINVGTGAAARVITLGNVTGASQIVLNAGTGGIQLASTGAGDITVASSDTVLIDSAGVLELNSSAGIINIGDDAVAQNINVGIGAAARVITMGNVTGATQLVFNAGTGGIQLASTGAGDITLNSSDTLLLDSAGILELNSSAGIISIGNDAVAQNIDIGTGGAARTVTIGNNTGATSVVIDCGTGALNIGSNAIARTTTVGNATGASALVLQSGTGDTTMTGTVKEINAEFIDASGDDITFQMSPTTGTAANTAGAATGATGDLNLLSCQQGFMMEQFILGAGQTIIKPVMDANGLLISGDLAATEGYEYNLGAARTNSRSAFTIGTSLAFFLEVQLYIADMSGGNPYMIGFRKSEANNAVFANYTDYAAMGINTVTSAINVTILDRLNAGGQTATDTTDAWGGDGTAQTLTVLVSAAGVTTFEIGGVAATAAPAYTFDNTDVVVPFIHLIHGAVVPGAVNLVSWKCGFQA